MSKLILFDYNDAYILVKNIPVANTAVPGAATNNEKRKKKKKKKKKKKIVLHLLTA